MYRADLKHSDKGLQEKLEYLYTLNRAKSIDLSFRPPYLNLLKAFGNPHEHLPPIIHVAGTNGKGSTIAMLRSILEEAGYKVHTYTSPHLFEFNERIVLAGKPIENDLLEELIDQAITFNDNAEITFFEITTAIAFEAFRRTPADIVLLEVGLGGRLDCTNIISKPDVSLINTVSYDHMEYLGTTLEEIAKEKAGIMKYETPCIVGCQFSESNQSDEKTPMDIFVDSAADKKAPLFCASRDWSVAPHDKGFKFTFKGENKIYPLPNLIGNHQIKNAGLALAALEVIKDKFPVPETDKQNGLQKTTWKGRLERITQSHLCNSLNPDDELWYDGGHNDSAGHAIAEQIKNWNINNPKSTHLILGMKADKRPMDYLKSILPQIDSLTITKVNDIGPCITADHVEPNLKGQSICFLGQENDLDKAIANIMSLNPSNEPKRIMICGSLYLAEKL